jgi:hypothetical protein
MSRTNGSRNGRDEDLVAIQEMSEYQIALQETIIEQARKEAELELRGLAPPSNVRFGNGDMAGRRRLLGSGA